MAMDSERASDTMRTSCKDSSSIIDLKIAGLDPLFKTCLKLTVKDIFQSQSLITHQAVGITGIFCFKNHLINRVEVMGVVVRVDRREKCNSYAIDDGTGVIGCTCWKNPSSALEPNVFFSSLPLSLQEKYDEILSCHISNTEEGYNLGDLILVRGRITVFRDMKEISVLDHRKIVNPNVELERLLRLPHLYAIYNKPFTPPTTVGKQLMMTSSDKHSVNELTLKYTIRQLLKNPIPVPCEITPQDLLTWPGIVSLLPPVQGSPNYCPSAGSGPRGQFIKPADGT